MNKKKTNLLNRINAVQILEGLLILFWLFSWLSGYIKDTSYIYFSLLLTVIIFIAVLLIIKASKWLKLLWVVVLIASIVMGVLMVVSYNLSANLQY